MRNRSGSSWNAYFKDAGFKTMTACHGVEAIQVAASMQPLDLLVTDLMMPEMTGDELARRLRQADRSLKVLYLTGYADQLFKEKATLWQDEAFLDKPCSVKGLLEAVSQLLSAISTFRLERRRNGSATRPRLSALAAAGVHLQVRILAERFQRHERASIAERQARFRSPVVPREPAAGDGGLQLLDRCAPL